MLSSLYVRLGIIAGLFLAGLFVGFRIEHHFYTNYRVKVEAAAAAQAAAAKAKEDDWAKQLTEARAINAENQKWISDHNKPVPRVLCHYAGASPMPASPATTGSGPASTGELPSVSGGDFDPTDRLTALADKADQVVEACRLMLNSWPR